MTSRDAPPAPFQRAVETMSGFVDAGPSRPEIVIEDIPAPQRLAPYSGAMAPVYRDDDRAGRRPAHHALRPGRPARLARHFRLVAYVRADLEPEITADPLLGPVAWSWLTEALDQRRPVTAAAGGTVTSAVSEGFGDKAEDP